MNDVTNAIDEMEVTDTAETLDENAESVDPSDYRIIYDMIKEMDEMTDNIYKESASIVESTFGLNHKSLMAAGLLSDEKIDGLVDDPETVDEFFKTYAITKKGDHDLPFAATASLEQKIAAIKEIKKFQVNILNTMEESKKLKEESNDILNDYINYLSSDAMIEARKKRLETCKELAEKEPDPVKKKKIEHMIEVMSMSEDLGFIFIRLQKLGDDEKKSVLESFFDDKRGNYVIQRYNNKIGKFGFDVKAYRLFFNLEEKFCDESVHPFNNLFLFYVMRFVAYADPYNRDDKLYVQSIISMMSKLIYHNYPSNDAEKNFVHLIETFDNYFSEYYDYFMENNTMRPGHPVRLASTHKYQEDRKRALIAKMNELGITGYDENVSADELQDFFNKKLEAILDEERLKKAAKNKKLSENVEPSSDNTTSDEAAE